jgi:hypothetical protein
MKKLYHMSSTDNRDKIMSNGIICGEDNHIYLIDTLHIHFPIFNFNGYIPDIVALNQLYIDKYDLYEISTEGVEEELLPDNVMESTSEFQKRVMQKNISKKFINHIERRTVDVKSVHIYNGIVLFFLTNTSHRNKNKALCEAQYVSPKDQIPIPQWIVDSAEAML